VEQWFTIKSSHAKLKKRVQIKLLLKKQTFQNKDEIAEKKMQAKAGCSKGGEMKGKIGSSVSKTKAVKKKLLYL
jgi:hypothetical protein